MQYDVCSWALSNRIFVSASHWPHPIDLYSNGNERQYFFHRQSIHHIITIRSQGNILHTPKKKKTNRSDTIRMGHYSRELCMEVKTGNYGAFRSIHFMLGSWKSMTAANLNIWIIKNFVRIPHRKPHRHTNSSSMPSETLNFSVHLLAGDCYFSCLVSDSGTIRFHLLIRFDLHDSANHEWRLKIVKKSNWKHDCILLFFFFFSCNFHTDWMWGNYGCANGTSDLETTIDWTKL